MTGESIGHFEVREKIGQGGMGEVYLARDTKLQRDVAIKSLPAAFTDDEDRLARFQREARLLASLNHPNIGAIHGVEESDDNLYLVLEYVPGGTLAEVLREGPLGIRDCLEVFQQIALGLEAAHDQRIIHRDLKPANVKVGQDRRVKLLDFGLGKATATEFRSLNDADETSVLHTMTAEGVIFGTTAYMSPEQARGRPVDRRADIWAFGCMLYEALSGNRIFDGDTVPEVFAAILGSEPDWDQLPDGLPPELLELLSRCLRKDPRQRLQDIGDARIALEEISVRVATGKDYRPLPAWSAPARSSPLMTWIAGLAALVAAVALWSPWHTHQVGPRGTPKWFELSMPPIAAFGGFGRAPELAISRDGSRLVIVGVENGRTRLFLREMAGSEFVPIPGTENATLPFFSPDGDWVGFFDQDDQTILKVSLLGAPPRVICSAPDVRGVDWGAGDQIVFSGAQNTGLFQVSADGGEPREITTPDLNAGEKSHRLPRFLPDGRNILFTIGTTDMPTWDSAMIAVLSLDSGEIKEVLREGSNPAYAPSGHLIFGRAGGLYAVKFDLGKLEASGSPVIVRAGVATSEVYGGAQYALADDGTLVYVSGSIDAPERSLIWIGEDGREEDVGAPIRYFYGPRLAPDGLSVAVSIGRANDEVWLYDFTRGGLTRLVYGGGDASRAVWTPDGLGLVYVANSAGRSTLSQVSADGSGTRRDLVQSEFNQYPGCVSSDGEWLLFTAENANSDSDILMFQLKEEGARPQTYQATASMESMPDLSPDGRWLAYASNSSGRLEVFVQSFPDPGARHQVSTRGGTEPVWSRSGEHLLYVEGDRIMRVRVLDRSEAFVASRPEVVLSGYEYGTTRQFRGFDLDRTGDRVLSVKLMAETEATDLQVMVNWLADLSSLVPER